MRRRFSMLLASVLLPGLLLSPLATGSASAADPVFTRLEGFATKTGFRGVFAWSAAHPVAGLVHYGTDPDNLDKQTAPLPGVDDTSQMAVADGLALHSTVYWRVEDLNTGDLSEIRSFKAENAWNNFQNGVYTINLLVQLDSQSLPPEIPHDLAIADIAQGMSIFAERLYDASDKYIRLGKVLVTDTNLDYAANIPNTPSIALNACGPQHTGVGPNLADVIVQTSQPFDSHTYSGFAIGSPCISFYVGRIGQLVIEWADDLHMGYISTHEMSHYALNAPDLYPVGQAELPADAMCDSPTSGPDMDVSVMHNSGGWKGDRWRLTEFDRNATLTPCDMGSPAKPFTWNAMRTPGHYTNIPANAAGPIDHIVDALPRGNPDGGALEIVTMDREPGASTLTAFTPFDGGGLVCTNQSPVILDPEDDANQILGTGTPAPSEPNLDVTKTFLTYEAGANTVTFHIKVKDLTATHPNGSQGEIYELFFRNGTQQHYLDISRTDLSGEVFFLADADNGARGTRWFDVTGSFNEATDEITAVLPLATYNTELATRLEPDPATVAAGTLLNGFSLTTRKDAVAVVPDADSAVGQCDYSIGQEQLTSTGLPVAVDDSVTTTENVELTADVVANDTDPDSEPLSLLSVTNGALGTTNMTVDGKARYIPNTGATGVDTFTYVVTDPSANTDVGTVTVTILPGPRPPTAVADTVALPSGGGQVDVLFNDTDENNDPLVLTGVTQGARGTTSIVGGKVAYTPTTGWGSDTFTYTVTDGAHSVVGSVVVVNATCASTYDQPLAAGTLPAGWSTQLAQGANSPAWAVRPDALTHTGTYAFHSSAESAEIKDDRLISPAFRATAATELTFWHRYAFENAFDGGVLEVSTDNGLSWRDVLEAGGTFAAGPYTGVIDATSTAPLRGRAAWTSNSFIDADTEVVVKLGALANQLVRLRWRLGTDDIVPGFGVPGWWVDDVRLTGIAALGCASGPNTSAPVAVADVASTKRNVPVVIPVMANDSDGDGDALTISAVAAPAHGTTTVVGSGVRYVPAPGFSGTDTFGYDLSDGESTGTGTVTVTVRPLLATPGDFSGDGITEHLVFRPSSRQWLTRNGTSFVFGNSGDVPVPADYDGDGRVDYATYRPASLLTAGTWTVRGGATYTLGLPGDIPAPADYNGDLKAEPAVYRPSTGQWYFLTGSPVRWGQSGDIPVPADYDGDGDDDIALYRPVNGFWYILGQTGDAGVNWGLNGDYPVPADYDGDGDSDVAVFRPSNGVWYVRGPGGGEMSWGQDGDIPQPGDYNGDGVTDVAVYRPGNGHWYVRNISTVAWGVSGDLPVVLPAAQRR